MIFTNVGTVIRSLHTNVQIIYTEILHTENRSNICQ